MKQVLRLFLLLLFINACEKPEDVVPTPPQAEEGPADPQPEPLKEESLQPLNEDAEYFQYGMFRDMPFRILTPRGYDSTKNYPFHIFLHGIGESGVDNENQLTLGGAHFLADSIRENYPAFVVFPQCPSSHYWFDKEIMETLSGMIGTLMAGYSIDKEKISIGGFSMGAYGTFAMVAANPGFFESAIAISGDGDHYSAASMAKTRWRIFAGKKDDVVPSTKSEKIARALTNAGASVRFTLYPEADHGQTWFHAFSEQDFFHWLFKEGPESATLQD